MAIRPTQPIRKIVIIEDGLLASMASNPKYINEFPFLKPLQNAPARQGCGGCGRGAGSQRSALFTQAKQALAGMSDDRRRLLKQLLNAAKIRITYKNGSRIVEHTF